MTSKNAPPCIVCGSPETTRVASTSGMNAVPGEHIEERTYRCYRCGKAWTLENGVLKHEHPAPRSWLSQPAPGNEAADGQA